MTSTMPAPTLTSIAATGDRFTDFAPYVASLDDEGLVAFQAATADGGTGVFSGDGGAVREVAHSAAEGCPVAAFSSHPDLDGRGALSVYGALKSGGEALVMIRADGRVETLGAPDGLPGIGPLGPTMSAGGGVAFRATTPEGRACLRLWRAGRVLAIAEADDPAWGFTGFEGLPVVDEIGGVAFRANLAGGRQGVFVHRGGRCMAVATSDDGFDELGRFPTTSPRGDVAFVARRASGAWGLFQAGVDGRGLACLLDTATGAGAGFESLRGLLVDDAGLVAFYATPVGGQLGIYRGPDARRDRVLGLGDALLGGTVADFALNPVSVNARRQLAIRVALEDGRQFVLRDEPRT